MNPVFEQYGYTPTQAIAFRAAAKAKGMELRNSIKEQRAALGITGRFDHKAAMSRPPRLGQDNQPKPVVKKWPK